MDRELSRFLDFELLGRSLIALRACGTSRTRPEDAAPASATRSDEAAPGELNYEASG